MFKGLEHPSGFPSMLRGSTPEPRPLTRKDSHGSTNQLRRTDSNGISTPNSNTLSQRKDSTATTSNRRDSFGSSHLTRKDSNASVLTRKDSSDLKSNKRDSFTDDFRRLSFGNSIYLRPDSTGATNLIRRDSFGRRDSHQSHRHPRDYVSKLFEYKGNFTNGHAPYTSTTVTDKDPSSILRKTDNDAQLNKENVNSSDLTAANLTKHVTILEKCDDGDADKAKVESYLSRRRDSSGSLSNYLTSRRISIDSLDVRNSRRGSSASADINLNSINDAQNEEEVNLILFLFRIG